MSVLGGMGLQLAIPAPDVTFTMSQLESSLNVGRSQSEPTEQMQKVNPAMDRLLGALLPTYHAQPQETSSMLNVLYWGYKFMP
jgi:hypothetical protein